MADAAAPPAALPAPFTGDALRCLELLRDRIGARTADCRNLAVLMIDCGVIGRIDAVWGYHIGDGGIL